MDPERWRDVETLYHATLARPAGERAAFLEQACAGDDDLRREVQSLLDQPGSGHVALEGGALAMAAKAVAPAAPLGSLLGRRLGPYAVTARLGAGGMGEVFRARDSKLNRDVALKVLPTLFALDADRLARFRREAHVLASLNHPNIGAIYGLEEADGMSALVLELVDGPTLADRLAQGPVSLKDALPIARQLCEALDAAHEHGVIHRDLKPANIKLRPDGVVKVLDFGLAKAAGGGATGSDLTQSPTVSGTREGVILGTPAYMSPEQARGQVVDKRTDIWAFGCVLYEMLTGRPAFAFATIPDTLAAILDRDPDWAILPERLHPQLRRLLRRCLEKDPARRLRDIGDASVEIDELSEGSGQHVVATQRAPLSRQRTAIAGVVAMIVAGIGWAVWMSRPGLPQMPTTEVRLELMTPPTRDLLSIAVAPDGLQVVFTGEASPNAGLWVRELRSGTPRFLPGTEGASFPFWSPDGRSVGFFAENRLKRLDLTGGTPQVLADAPNPHGGAWGADGTILFAPTQITPIMRVRATGGEITAVTRIEPQQLGSLFPYWLPDGAHFLYTVSGTVDVQGVYIGGFDGFIPRRLLSVVSAAVLTSSGHLLFARNGTLFAQMFDPDRLALVGEPIRVADSVATGVTWGAAVSTSAAGPIVYRARPSVGTNQLVWFDRSGNELTRLGAPSEPGQTASMSPDGRQMALSRMIDGNRDIWLADLGRSVFSRLTIDAGNDVAPLWTPDGSRIVFGSSRSGILGLYQKAVTGGNEEPLLVTAQNVNTSDLSPDGRVLLYSRADPKTLRDLGALPLGSGEAPFPVMQTPGQDLNGQFAPNGTWFAYQSNESGRYEVSLRPFRGTGRVVQVSTEGGTQPRWRRNGRELFYLGLDRRLMAVSVTFSIDGQAVEVGIPSPLFQTQIGGANTEQGQYLAASDGQRFLLDTPTRDAPPPITVILNWRPVF